MDYFKKIEKELILEWRKLQLENSMKIRDAATKSYYVKFRLYQLQKRRQLVFTAANQPEQTRPFKGQIGSPYV